MRNETPNNIANQKANPPLVLMIEPQEEKAFAVQLASEAYGGWQTQVVTTCEALEQLANNQIEPTLIGFHATPASLPDGTTWNPAPFHAVLARLNWGARTVLVSGGGEGQLERMVGLTKDRQYAGAVPRDAWVDYLLQELPKLKSSNAQAIDETIHFSRSHAVAKNLDSNTETTSPEKIGVLKKLLKKSESPASNSSASDWTESVNRLQPAVMVLKEAQPLQAPEVVLSNQQAIDNPWARQDYRRWAWLRAELKDPVSLASKRAHLLDWDAQAELPVDCRLYDLGDGWFWYTRDWRSDQQAAKEEAFDAIGAERSLAKRFDKLADYLAKRWAISRLQLMEVTPLPEGMGHLKIGVDSTEDWVADHVKSGAQKNLQTMEFLVLPRYQSGLGWTAVENKTPTDAPKGHPAHWWTCRYTWSDFKQHGQDNALPANNEGRPALKRQDVFPHDLKDQQQYIFESMEQPCPLSDSVDWGDAKTRLLVLVPAADKTPDDSTQQAPKTARPVRALLAMDRRSNHLSGDEKSQFTAAEQKRIETLSRGVIGEPLNAEVVRSMNHGALSAVRSRVAQWLDDAREARAMRWNKEIDQAVAQSAGRGQGMEAVSSLCAALQKAWPDLWQTECERLFLDNQVPPDFPQLPDLSQLFLVTAEGHGRVSMPAGVGPLWVHYRSQATWPKVEPFSDLLADGIAANTWCVKQDFQNWWKELGNQQRQITAFKAAEPHFQNTRSWAAIRLDSGAGVPPVLMVAHFAGESKQTHQIWLEVLQLLQLAAERLRAPFLLAWNEIRERSVWASSVAHEMKNMALMALDEAGKLKTQPHPSTLEHLMERLQQQVYLAQDFMYALRPDLSADENTVMASGLMDIAASIQAIVSVWKEDRPQITHIVLSPEAGTNLPKTHLHAAQAWQRVVRVLLHNAFRHGQGEVHIAWQQSEHSLQLTVENGATETAIRMLQQENSWEVGHVHSAFVRRHMGMRVAQALCASAKATLSVHPSSGQVKVTLHWPLAVQDESIKNTDPVTCKG